MMRVAIKPLFDSEPVVYGRMLGLLTNETGCDRCSSEGYSAVVQLDGHGMVVQLFHVSRVTFIEQRGQD